MAAESTYDIGLCNSLKEKYREQQLFRPMKTGRYDAGERLTYTVTDVSSSEQRNVQLEIIKFVGGGFAGQVYKVKILDFDEPVKDNTDNKYIAAFPIEKDRIYAMKILIPPSGFSLWFRNFLYRIGFQGAFQLQVNPDAARSGALWQKFIRRGAKIIFGREDAVNNIHVTFVDETLGSCGEISDWVDGRTWRLEVDERLAILKKYLRGKLEDFKLLGSPEYRAKRKFMKDFVNLLHDMGAHEFARQYEWSTCKSQPNTLKRNDTENDPEAGLMAVDFRAGLALLPLLPMSPGDVILILKGLARGSLVQFDRGNIKKLEKFIEKYKDEFTDMLPLLDDLKKCEAIYRDSVPDITHNHLRIFFSPRLWSTMLKSWRTGWRIQNKIDDATARSLGKSIIKTLLFSFLGAIPFLGNFLRKIWGRSDMRKHYGSLLTSWNYIRRSGKARCAEKAFHWYRAGRINSDKAKKIAISVPRFFVHLPLSIMPCGIHRILTDRQVFKERMYNIFIHPIRLYFSPTLREKWLRDMLAQGQANHILNKKDAAIIDSQLKEPYIQKYLKSLAVHVCTLPVTQIVSITLSWLYVRSHPGLSPAEAAAAVAFILGIFQVTPVSPGSLVRGLYVVGLVIKERNLKDYNIALGLSFFKYIGYLAFPIQMAYRYPELARFMAGHFSTEIVHAVPVFGERGALLEHWIFRLFYNWPLTIRQKMARRAEIRATQKSRYWHTVPYTIVVIAVLTTFDYFFTKYTGIIPSLSENWWIAIILIIAGASGITLGCRGAAFVKRFISVLIWSILIGLLYPICSAFFLKGGTFIIKDLLLDQFWHVFLFAVFGVISAIITELRLPYPEEGILRQ